MLILHKTATWFQGLHAYMPLAITRVTFLWTSTYLTIQMRHNLDKLSSNEHKPAIARGLVYWFSIYRNKTNAFDHSIWLHNKMETQTHYILGSHLSSWLHHNQLQSLVSKHLIYLTFLVVQIHKFLSICRHVPIGSVYINFQAS